MELAENLRKDLKKSSNKDKAKLLQRFFKTGKGEYAEGDIFLGISVPQQRKLAKKYSNLDILTLQSLLDSKIHEERLIALLILVENYKKSREEFLRELARQAAARVRETKENLLLKPMSAYERRVVHAEIGALPDIMSESIGQEPERRVLIKPKTAS